MTRKPSLLIVDDSEPNRDVLSRRLAQRGYTVTVAAGGREALELIDANLYDLILLDVEMPEVSGLDVLSRVRTTKSQTELPVIMVTARTQGADIVDAFRRGANDYVTKPIDFPVALARISTHLSHKSAVADLRDSEERYALAVSGARDGIWDWNLTTNQVYWSARWKRMLGYEEPEIGADINEWFSRVHGEDILRVRERLAEHLSERTSHYECEHRIRHRDGTFRWVLCRGAAVWDTEGTPSRIAGSLTDVTDSKVADGLTGLPNQHVFIDLVDRAITRTERHPDRLFALLLLGLDRFEAVNDGLGPITADRLLVEVANRLRGHLRPTDAVAGEGPAFTLARLGGDEFNVLIDDIADASDAIRVAIRLHAAFEQPFVVDGHQVFTSASIGIAVAAGGYEQADDVMRDAAVALHRAKAVGAAYEIFDPVMRERAVSRLRLETDLRHAIEHQGFEVHYQPIVSVESGGIAGFEALVRWGDPARRAMGPAEFIPVAESAGMIGQICRLTLIESCRQMVAWQRRFGASAPASMCVNVSSRQFAEPGFARLVESVLELTGLHASCLKLEITESAFIDDLEAARATLQRLRFLGVRCSLDDFGTGYSSLSYLHQLDVDTLKIDRSFVTRIGADNGGSEMIGTIVTLGHALGKAIVAEGVETAAQFARLRALGCEYVQGFYFSVPVTAPAAERLIDRQPWTAGGSQDIPQALAS